MAKKFVRKKAKQYPMVEFTLPDIYGDTALKLPKLTSFTLKTQAALSAGNLDVLFDELEEAKVEEEVRDAVSDLQEDEVDALMKAWRDAGPAAGGKSAA